MAMAETVPPAEHPAETTAEMAEEEPQAMEVDAGRVDAAEEEKREEGSGAEKTRRVAFVGAEYIEYDLAAAPVVRRFGLDGFHALAARSDAEIALEWRARAMRRLEDRVVGAPDSDSEPEELFEHTMLGRKPKPEPTVERMRARLDKLYAKETRKALLERGFPCLDAAQVPLRVQLRASELLVAWSVVSPQAAEQSADTAGGAAALDASATLDKQRKHLELCRKQVFGPVVDGYAFGRRFFSIDSFLSLLELEELVALAEAHGFEVPALPADVLAKIKVADRELISTYSPTGMGKPLKMLTFRELVEEAYARGILMEDDRDAKNKKSKRAWVDALRPALHAEMRAFKIREAHADLIHAFLATALDAKMQSTRMETIVALINDYFRSHPEASDASSQSEEMAAVHRYFCALLEWRATQPPVVATTVSSPKPSVQPESPPAVASPPSQPRVVLEPMSPIV